MAIVLYLIKNLKSFVREVGIIDEDDFRMILNEANKKKLGYLSFIDYIGDTVLNQKQLKILQKELEFLESDNQLNSEAINIFRKAIQQALREKLYLLINGE